MNDMKACLLDPGDTDRWNGFVAASGPASIYHLAQWKGLIEETFGHRCYYISARDAEGNIHGVLPLVYMKSILFGRFIVSLPFFNYGGVCSTGADASRVLMDEAVRIAMDEGASHMELRHTENTMPGMPVKTSKVSMLLELPGTVDELMKSFGSKLRSQIKKPEKEGLTARVGGAEELDAFYHVFSLNMRDLGTPVYSKRFFDNIMRVFRDSARICTVYTGQGEPAASGFLIGFRDRLEIPWASSLRRFNPLSPNMLLYSTSLRFACENGYGVFDFGRSTPGEGTYRFKEQWGARPLQHYWHYWLRDGGALPEINPKNPKYEFAIRAWRSFPLSFTKFIGPHIVKNLP